MGKKNNVSGKYEAGGLKMGKFFNKRKKSVKCEQKRVFGLRKERETFKIKVYSVIFCFLAGAPDFFDAPAALLVPFLPDFAPGGS